MRLSSAGAALAAAAAAAVLVLPGPAVADLPPVPLGNVTAAYDLVDRLLPGTSSSSHFVLSLAAACPGVPAGQGCFSISDAPGGKTAIVGVTTSDVTAGLGFYFRELCNMTIGWPRGGGNNIFVPNPWPTVGAGAAVTKTRKTPYTYSAENVCTSSYSLVWYSWDQWSQYIDLQALNGVNLKLSLNGQEELAYQVFAALGLDDFTIRSWFNGPAFLTWSRGQNEYGNNIAGPLPRSWMQDQLALQLQILQRQRQLGIVGMLPGFQANVPWALAAVKTDSNMTQQGDTGWMNSVDPLFAEIADAWMAKFCSVMGCQDKWFQLDGYFDGATAPWITQGIGLKPGSRALPASAFPAPAPAPVPSADLPACTWSALQPGTYLAQCDATNCASYPTLAAAQAACIADTTCGGITSNANGQTPWEIRAGNQPQASPVGEASYYITNYAACRPPPPPITPDPVWMERGAAAYMGLNRTVPGAVWSFQGWAIIDWSTQPQGSAFRGFVDAVPQGNFVVVDMSVDGTGEWGKWDSASFFGAPFIWTSLHDFGGTDAMKGDVARANQIPFGGLSPLGNSTVVGVGATPEGIDQNPIYYELLAAAPFRDGPIPDLTDHAVRRAARRYGLAEPTPELSIAWALLVDSTYAQDLSVQDPTGIPHLPGSASQFNSDRATPTARLCLTWQAWGQLLAATSYIDANTNEPFRYDLINLGRELLAQLSTPASQNFSDAYSAKPVDGALANATGSFYLQLLLDADTLLQTESAFLLGPWLAMARAWGANSSDCVLGTLDNPVPCPDFYEFNARVQLTTWNPTPKNASSIPGGPIDYASKHWSGLIHDYYATRAAGILALAQKAAAAGTGISPADMNAFLALNAYTFQNTFGNNYPLEPVGDPVAVSKAMYAKYAPWYSTCAS